MSEDSTELPARDLHILGKVSGFYGVKGWVKIYSYTQPRENIVRYKALKIRPGNSLNDKGGASASCLEDKWQDIQLDSGKAHGKGVVAHFIGYDNREIAAALIGAELAVPRCEFKPAAKDEYYWTDLIELTAINLEGVELGRVSRLIETAANDVLVINPRDDVNKDNSGTINKSEILIPFVYEHFIKKVDLQDGSILVDWPVSWNESNESK